MKIDAKGLALLIVVISAVVVGAYSLGLKQSAQQSTPDKTVSNTTAPNTSGSASSAQAAKQLLPANTGNMPSNHPTMPSQNNFTHFKVGNRNVKGMLSDGKSVWVGTSGGAIRYDIEKNDYKIFDVNNGSLISNGVFHLSKLRGKIMVGTYGGGMSTFDQKTEKWKNYNIPDGLADQFVYDIAEDGNGDYWIATWSGVNHVPGGNMDEPKGWTTYTVENTKGGLPNDWVYGVEIGKNGNVWFATEGGLARLDKDRKWTNWQHEDGLGAPYDKVKKDIAFSNDPAKASKHHATQKAEQGLSDVKVGYNPNYIVSMTVDEQGIVWCGTWGGGLSKFDGKQWTTFTVTDGLPGNHVFMLKQAKNGQMWIGTNKGLAQTKSSSGFIVLTKAQGLFAENVFSLAEADDGTLWVGSFGGVAKISKYAL